MSPARKKLVAAAKQLVETDLLLGGAFMPAKQNPLPQPVAPTPAPASGAARSPGDVPPAKPAGKSDNAPAFSIRPRDEAAQAAPALTREEKQAALDKLFLEEVLPCQRCPLCSQCTQKVLGEGNPEAQLMFVGEAPGEEEDRTGRPFVGRAGEMLTKWIVGMGLSREQVYIANTLKCRPPNNRAPLPDEIAACLPHLLRQIAIIRPTCIVTLGNPATQTLLQTKIGITKLRGQWQTLPALSDGLEGIPVMPTFHPAFLLRAYTQENRQFVWNDLQQVMKLLGLGKK